ncbi:MAG: RNA-binding protein [Candidatus Helarchaeota archaeon]|nr:RNA-binding protein [Candidatus Helarchaeota archaeon]NVM54755.1 RNA-binding protein [Candidatus Helarchaeota archaeon]
MGDLVIGKIINTTIVSWKIDINSAYTATLHASTVLDRSFNPLKDDIRRHFEVGDIIAAEITAFNRTRDPVLSLKGRGLGKLRRGRIIEIIPAKVPRLIGRKGSMINLIKNETNCRLIIGQNGRVWMSGKTLEIELLIERLIRKIEKEAHTSGLTDRVKELIQEEMKNLEVS